MELYSEEDKFLMTSEFPTKDLLDRVNTGDIKMLVFHPLVYVGKFKDIAQANYSAALMSCAITSYIVQRNNMKKPGQFTEFFKIRERIVPPQNLILFKDKDFAEDYFKRSFEAYRDKDSMWYPCAGVSRGIIPKAGEKVIDITPGIGKGELLDDSVNNRS